VLDADLENPPDDPLHCPPAFTWVAFHDGETISRLHFHHAPRLQS
jgi:RNA polymerase sigma-70 factor (ECF subfamily)